MAISVPRQARLDEIKLVNGRLDIKDVAGEVRASCVNGRMEVQNLQGRTELNTVNGTLDASVAQLPSSGLKLSSVNGGLHVTLPSDASAEVEASTISGSISNDFGLTAIRHQYVGHSLHGQLGGGGTLVKLSNVNGTIEIRHATDGRTLSPATNLERARDRDRDQDNDRDDDELRELLRPFPHPRMAGDHAVAAGGADAGAAQLRQPAAHGDDGQQ